MVEHSRVYVGNLPYNITWQDLKDFMRQAGEVVRADVMLNGKHMSRGCGIVEYATAEEAQRAIETLMNAELQGRNIFVREDREAAGVGLSSNSMAAVRGPRPPSVAAAPGTNIFVSNLPYSTSWQDLKDLFRSYGNVLRSDVHQTPRGRSRGHGSVIFETPEEAQAAIAGLNGTELGGRELEVRLDRPLSERPLSSAGAAGIAGAAGHRRAGGHGDSYHPFQQASGNGEPSDLIHASNLPWRTTDDDLLELFQSIAPVKSAKIQLLPGGRSAGTGVVQFVDASGAEAAIAELDGYTYGDLKIVVTYARFPPDVPL